MYRHAPSGKNGACGKPSSTQRSIVRLLTPSWPASTVFDTHGSTLGVNRNRGWDTTCPTILALLSHPARPRSHDPLQVNPRATLLVVSRYHEKGRRDNHHRSVNGHDADTAHGMWSHGGPSLPRTPREGSKRRRSVLTDRPLRWSGGRHASSTSPFRSSFVKPRALEHSSYRPTVPARQAQSSSSDSLSWQTFKAHTTKTDNETPGCISTTRHPSRRSAANPSERPSAGRSGRT